MTISASATSAPQASAARPPRRALEELTAGCALLVDAGRSELPAIVVVVLIGEAPLRLGHQVEPERGADGAGQSEVCGSDVEAKRAAPRMSSPATTLPAEPALAARADCRSPADALQPPLMKAIVYIPRKREVLDPQGDAVKRALGTLGFAGEGRARGQAHRDRAQSRGGPPRGA